MMMGQRGFMPVCSQQKFARNNPRALVDQLIKRVLAVGARLSPNNRACVSGQIVAIHCHALAVTFHFQLLKIGGQTRQPLIIGQHRAARIPTNLIVPNPNHRQQNRQVLHQGRMTKMRIHRSGPSQKIIKPLWPNSQHQPQPNRPPN